MNQVNVGKFIASLRKAKNLTQEQFAEILGVNNRSVSRWENGNCMPDLSLLQIISAELDVSVLELLEGKRKDDFFIKEISYMSNYYLLMELNRRIIVNADISFSEKQEAVSVLLDGVACLDDIVKYKNRMRVNPDTDNIYPNFYIPPYNKNKKLRLVQGYLPKTHILYANHYELEILRLLYLLEPENDTINEMIENTLNRVKDTCFGNSCMQGECIVAGISVLRFVSTVKSADTEWIDKLLNPLGDIFLSFGNGQANVQNGVPLSYLLMAFTDINNEITQNLLAQKKEWLLDLLRRGWITGKLSNGKISEGDTFNLMGKYIIRNSLGTLPQFEDISQCEIYVNGSDGRCYCDI